MLAALKEKPIQITKEADGWVARTTINGVPGVQLQAVHVEMVKGAWIPSVAYVEIIGTTEYEVIEKVKGSGKAAKANALKVQAALHLECMSDKKAQPAATSTPAAAPIVPSPTAAAAVAIAADKTPRAGVVASQIPTPAPAPVPAPGDKSTRAGVVASQIPSPAEPPAPAPGDKKPGAGVLASSIPSPAPAPVPAPGDKKPRAGVVASQ